MLVSEFMDHCSEVGFKMELHSTKSWKFKRLFLIVDGVTHARATIFLGRYMWLKRYLDPEAGKLDLMFLNLFRRIQSRRDISADEYRDALETANEIRESRIQEILDKRPRDGKPRPRVRGPKVIRIAHQILDGITG